MANPFKRKIKKIIGKIFPNFVSPKRTKSKSFLREVAASRVAQALAIDSVPRTEFESFASKKFHNLNEMLPKEGSCQLFCKSSGTADKVLGVPHFLPVWLQKIILAIKRAFVPFNREIDHQYLMNFQLLAIFDVLIKGYDRHGGNFMINKETQDVWIIDNGNSFSSSHLDDYLLSRHYLAFLMFEEARKEFCPEILEYIKRIAEKQEDLVGIVAEALRDDFTPEVEQVFRDNMRLLTTLIDTENFMNSPIKTPMDLGKYVTTRDFDRALGRNHPVAQPGSMILQEG